MMTAIGDKQLDEESGEEEESLSEWRKKVNRRLDSTDKRIDDIVVHQVQYDAKVDDLERDTLVLRESTVQLRADMLEMKRNACNLIKIADSQSMVCAIILISLVFILYMALS